VYFTFVNLIKKKLQKQINLIKKTRKKNTSCKLSVKTTFKYCGFVKKVPVFTIYLFKIHPFGKKTNFSTKNGMR
jgi:hypothetical protein